MIIVRFADDAIIGFKNKADADQFRAELEERVKKFNLDLHSEETRLLEFGPFAIHNRKRRGEGKPETFNFLGFTLYCSRNQKGNFRVGLCTEKTRLQRALTRLQDQMRRMRHLPIQEQADHLNQMLRGHYAYDGIAGNFRVLQRVHRAVERYWRRMLSSRSWKGAIWWKQFHRIKQRFPLLRPKLYLPYAELQAIAVL
jgi:RNA-directed DNA polymerase